MVTLSTQWGLARLRVWGTQNPVVRTVPGFHDSDELQNSKLRRSTSLSTSVQEGILERRILAGSLAGNTVRRISSCFAPSAIRMPVSLVRRATEYDMIPYNPMQARMRASRPKKLDSLANRRS